MAYTMGGGLLLGAVIDWLAGTRPWSMLGLGLFGLVAGLTRFVREAAQMNRAYRPGAGRGTGREMDRAAGGGSGGRPRDGAQNPAEQENQDADRSPGR